MPKVSWVGKREAGISPSCCSAEGKRKPLVMFFPAFLDVRRVNAGVGESEALSKVVCEATVDLGG